MAQRTRCAKLSKAQQDKREGMRNKPALAF